MNIKSGVKTSSLRFRYRRIVFAVFMAIALLVSALATGSIIVNNLRGHNAQSQILARSNADSFSAAFTLAKYALDKVRVSQEAADWANAATAQSERYAATKLSGVVRKQLTGVGGTEYSLGAWKMDGQVDAVYLNGGSYRLHTFLTDNLGVSTSAEWEQMTQQAQNRGHRFLPVTASGDAETVVCLYYHKYLSGEVIYFIMLPYKQADMEWSISCGGELLATNLADLAKAQEVTAAGQQPGNVFTAAMLNEQLVYRYFADTAGFGSIGLYFIIFLVLIGSTSVVMYGISRRIYHPVEGLLQTIEFDTESNDIDEFELINANIVQLKLMNHTMEETLRTSREQWQEAKYYEILSGGQDQESGADTVSVCVMALEFDEGDTGDGLFLLKNELRIFAQENNAVFVSMQTNAAALLFFSCEENRVEKAAQDILHTILQDTEVLIGISEVMRGEKAMRRAYKQARRVIAERALFPAQEILRADQMQNMVSGSFYYPISTETELIHAVIKGSPSALDIFDDVVQENLYEQKVSNQTMDDFVLALVNTLNRLRASMKTTPHKLFGGHLSSAELLWKNDTKGASAAVRQIRQELASMIRAVQQAQRDDNDAQAEKLRSYIQQNYTRDIGLPDLAQAIGVSPQRCSVLFKQLTDDTFKKYLNRYRIEKAQEIQAEQPDITTNDLSALVGFNSVTTFIRAYKKYTGISPQAYRK